MRTTRGRLRDLTGEERGAIAGLYGDQRTPAIAAAYGIDPRSVSYIAGRELSAGEYKRRKHLAMSTPRADGSPPRRSELAGVFVSNPPVTEGQELSGQSLQEFMDWLVHERRRLLVLTETQAAELRELRRLSDMWEQGQKVMLHNETAKAYQEHLAGR